MPHPAWSGLARTAPRALPWAAHRHGQSQRPPAYTAAAALNLQAQRAKRRRWLSSWPLWGAQGVLCRCTMRRQQRRAAWLLRRTPCAAVSSGWLR